MRAVCSTSLNVEGAHVGPRGIGQKSSDLEMIPLCRSHHQHGYPESHHSLGKRFWSHHNIDRWEQIAKYQELFLETCATML